MVTRDKLSQNSYQPFLKEVDGARLNRDDLGRSLIYHENYLVRCENDKYVISKNNSDEIIHKIDIRQNDRNIDIEDRIIKGKTHLPSEIKKIIESI
jgi:hypothetical protein